MIITDISVRNFRCIKEVNLDFDHLNIIHGNNGQGKTSLVEAIYLLALTKSHKTSHEKEVITTTQEFSSVEANIIEENINTKLQIVVTPQKKMVKVDNDEIKKLSDYIGSIVVVMFAPDDLSLIKGEPGKRRRFMDLELGQTNKNFIKLLLLYRGVLKQRNELLKLHQEKEVVDELMFEVIDDQLTELAEKITLIRKEFLTQLNNNIKETHSNLTNNKEIIEIVYKPNVNQDMKTKLKSRLKLDILRGSTSVGPHRDDFMVLINGEDVSVYGSQGQQRSTTLSIKLGLIDFIKQTTGNNPILLLDDVFSELDENRVNNLVKYIDSDIQTFITTTDLQLLNKDILDEAKLFYVENGNFKVGEKHEQSI